MPNANVIERLVGANAPAQGTLAIPSINVSVAATTIFQNQVSGAAVLNPPGALLNAASAAPSFGVNLDGFAFKVRAAGKFTTAGTTNLTFILQLGTSSTAGSNTTIANTGAALAANTVSGNYYIEATLLWDSVNARLNGRYEAFITSGAVTQYVAPAVVLNSPPYSVTAQTGLQFVVGVIASGSVQVQATCNELVFETV